MGGPLPWVAATGKVDQDYSEAPHVVGSRGITLSVSGLFLALCEMDR